MNETNQKFPFKALGSRLKQLRERRHESVADVSNAVEIDPDVLSSIEEGKECPSEDILLLLISHFAAKEDLALKLRELAGYDQKGLPSQQMTMNPHGQIEQSVVVMPTEAQIVYTDMVHVMVNNYGVIMNFMQTSGSNTQPLAVARIGMSKEHAKSVLEVLQKTLEMQQAGGATNESTKE